MKEWEPRFVGLLRNVLSCRRKDGIPTQRPANEGLAHESQSPEAVNDDIKVDVKCAGDGGRASQGAPHPEKRRDRELDNDAKGNPRDHENTTVH